MQYRHISRVTLAVLVGVMIVLCSSCVCATDATPPSEPSIGWAYWQLSTDSTHATFSATDPESGIAGFEYAIGSTRGGTDVCGWTFTTAAEIAPTGLSFNHTSRYYIGARACNGAGLWGPYSYAGVMVVPLQLATCAEAKGCADGTYVYLTDKVDVGSPPALGIGVHYIQEQNRTSGIAVNTTGYEGRLCDTVGCMTTAYTERQISLVIGYWGGAPVPELMKPLSMTNKALAGKARNSYEGQVPGAVGANNVGLLVKTTGRVLAHWAGGFYIDDGSGLSDGVKPGLTVSCNGLGLLAPPVNSYVEVAGISSVSTLDTVPIRVLRPRRQSDIVPVSTPVAYIYDFDLDTANSFKTFLAGEGMPTQLISIGEAATADFGRYCLIIAGWDSGNVTGWGTAATVANVASYGKPILGIESGGLALFQQIGGLHYTFSTAAWDQGILMDATDVTSTIYSQPYAIPITDAARTIKVSTNASGWYGHVTLSPTPTGVTPLGNRPGFAAQSMMGWQSPRFMFWGFRDKPDLLTVDGKHLFVNAAWYAMLH